MYGIKSGQETTGPLITDLILSDHDLRLLDLAQDRRITNQRSWVRDDDHTTIIRMLDYKLSSLEIRHSFITTPIPCVHGQLAKLQRPRFDAPLPACSDCHSYEGGSSRTGSMIHWFEPAACLHRKLPRVRTLKEGRHSQVLKEW